MQTKELLSQDEIRALLDISPSAIPAASSAPDDAFSNAPEELLRYLQRSGLKAGSCSVVQKGRIGTHRCKSFKSQGYVAQLCIENRLTNAFIESILGGNSSRFEDDRVPGSLDEALLALLFSETQKLLQPYLQKVHISDGRQAYFLEFFLGNTKSVMKLVLENLDRKELRRPEEGRQHNRSVLHKIKVEAVLGVVHADILKRGQSYKLDDYAFARIILLMDNALAFRGKIVQTTNDEMQLLLEGPIAQTTYRNEYLVCAAESFLDDEMLLSLEYGDHLNLKLYSDLQIHKEGRFVAKAELFIKNGDIAVGIV
ncbi:hypothetical protein KKE54_07215 [bacterium]|nr:hypothetical protein [bacterium]